MQSSPTITELAKALSKAQGHIQHAARANENPFFKSKYADLASVTDACRKALVEHGLAVLHGVDSDDGAVVRVTCRLVHESGEWVESALALRPAKADPQSIGSAITYARRYTLAAMVGVATEDDDGNAAGAPSGPPARQRDVPQGHAKSADPGSVDRKALTEQVRAWSGVQPEDVPGVMNLLKRRLKIEGKLEEKDYARVSKFVADMGSKGKSLEDVQADTNAEDAR